MVASICPSEFCFRCTRWNVFGKPILIAVGAAYAVYADSDSVLYIKLVGVPAFHMAAYCVRIELFLDVGINNYQQQQKARIGTACWRLGFGHGRFSN